MATATYRPMNGTSKCTCGKRVDIMGWRYGQMFRYFCSAEHATIEGKRVDELRKAEELQPVRDVGQS